MNFSVGFMDNLFGEWVTLKVSGPNGEIIKHEATKKWLNKMEAEKKLIHVRIPDSAGESFNTWTIGEDVEPEIVEQWADKKSHPIHTINSYKGNEVDNYFVSKGIWEKEEIKREFGAT